MLLRTVFFITALVMLGGCREKADLQYNLVYPIQASKQQILRLEGTRFISTTNTPEISVIVLNNPVEDHGFVDIAFTVTNTTDHPLNLKPEMLTFRTKHGPLTVMTKTAYAERLRKGERYQVPEGYEELRPKMQSFGCAASKTEDNIKPSELTSSQKQVRKHYRDYRDTGMLDTASYFEGFSLEPGATRSAFVRIDLPAIDRKAERETLLMSLCPDNTACKKIRLVIQPL